MDITRSLFCAAVGMLASLPSAAEQATELRTGHWTEQQTERAHKNAGKLSISTPGALSALGAAPEVISGLEEASAGRWGLESDVQRPASQRWSYFHHDDVDRHQLDSGTRLTGWQLGDGVYFGRSKGDTSGVALIWQRSQTQQVSLSGDGLRLTRRLR